MDAAPSTNKNSLASAFSCSALNEAAAAAAEAWPSTSNARCRFCQSSSDMSLSVVVTGSEVAPPGPSPVGLLDENQPPKYPPPDDCLSVCVSSASPLAVASSSPSSRLTCACARARNKTHTFGGSFSSIASSAGAAPTASGGGHRLVCPASRRRNENHERPLAALPFGRSRQAPLTYLTYKSTYALLCLMASNTRSMRKGTAVPFPFLLRSRITASIANRHQSRDDPFTEPFGRKCACGARRASLSTLDAA
mmetsp:Transcript_4999/g.18623  ORF Transcript_4999/g.18623 Transcript_4999/m.18623 type:complete len:251 (-) Transcript_4999:1302-2054(-)